MHLLHKLFPAISGENASSGAGFHAFLTAFFPLLFVSLDFSWFLFLGTNFFALFLPFFFEFFTEDPPFLTSSFCTSGIFLLLSLFVLFFSAVFGHPRACALLFPQVLVTMGEIVKKEVNHGWI